MTVVRSVCGSLALALVSLTPLSAQCGLTWLPGAPGNGPDGPVEAVLSLPNGEIVAGGTFTTADAVLANNIARWDGGAWRAMASGANGAVRCLARLTNGDVVAGGTFTTMGGVPCNRIARWNGAQWAPMGAGFDQEVSTLLALPGGEVVAGGAFVNAGVVPMPRVARWNGFAWTPLGAGLSTGRVRALARMPNGDLVAGSSSTSSPLYGLDRWNGTTWQGIPGLDTTFSVNIESLAVLPNGTLAMVGAFALNATFPGMAIWNGATIQPLVTPVSGNARQLLVANNGDLVVGGVGIQAGPSLARWDGALWTPIAGAPSTVRSLAQDTIGRLVVGATPPSTFPKVRAVSRYDGSAWQTLGAPVPPVVNALTRLPNGDVVAAGQFTTIGGVAADNVARWNGSTWAPLGLGVDGAVRAATVAPNGDLIVGGSFQNAGGSPANQIARWNGSAWSTMGAGLPLVPTSLATLPNGDVFAASLANVSLRRWNGATWSLVPFPGSVGVVQSMARLPNGDLALAGVFIGFVPSPVGVVRYSAGTLSAIPGAPSTAFELFTTASGDLIVGGSGVRRWDGTTWSSLGGQIVAAFAELPNGDLLGCGGPLTIGGQVSAVYRYGAAGAEALGTVQGGAASCLLATPAGDVWAGGQFTTASGFVATGLVRAVPTCPGGAVPAGAGCTGGAGPVTLQAVNTPWLGGTFRAEASGMTSNSLALQVFGAAAAPQPLPLGAPGCSLLVTAVSTDALVPANGIASAAVAVPNSASLIGAQIRMQVLGIELGSLGIVRLTGSNALDLTVGSY